MDCKLSLFGCSLSGERFWRFRKLNFVERPSPEKEFPLDAVPCETFSIVGCAFLEKDRLLFFPSREGGRD